MEQERSHFEDDIERAVSVPQYMKEIVAEITRLARRSPDINQRSGVSVRASIADYESMLANAMRRAIRLNEKEVVPRVSDLPFVLPALTGKIEFETVDDGREEQIVERLIQGAVLAVFNHYFSLGERSPSSPSSSGSLSVSTTQSVEYAKLTKAPKGCRLPETGAQAPSAPGFRCRVHPRA
jgi:magnesium chelatase subunit I